MKFPLRSPWCKVQICCLCFLFLGTLAAPSWAKLMDSLKPGHPRLLVSSTTWTDLQEHRRQDALLDQYLRRLETDARLVLDEPPVVYEKQGYRLLAVSRLALRRVLLLSLQYHVTGDVAFARRAEQEMLTAAAFHDWNPSHFLDTAEMTTALALGYDWLFDQLTPESRLKIRTAIVELGLKPGLGRNWGQTTNNWNAVCLGGMTLGALAVAEDGPELAERVLEKVRQDNPAGMRVYAPDGVYPEGPMYWGYGTSFQVILLAALESALDTDWGIGRSPGFMESAGAYLQTVAPSGRAFNFFDGVEGIGIEPQLFWFAGKQHQPGLAEFQRQRITRYIQQPARGGNDGMRLASLAAIWWPQAPEKPAESLPLHWFGRSQNPLAIFRGAWNDPKAMYLGLKGGSAVLSHGHMDAGSFIFESDGVRWASDLGMQDYNSLESKGIKMWDSAQNGARWTVFRFNNFSHNTLTLDNQLHHASAQARITRFFDDAENSGAIVDLTEVLGQGITRATRGFVFRPNQRVVIVDELEGLKPGANVRWTMVTGADISLDGRTAHLRKEGQQLQVSLVASIPAQFETASADPSADGFNAPNPGMQLLVANVQAPESGRVRIAVTLQPGAQPVLTDTLADVPLAAWPESKVQQ